MASQTDIAQLAALRSAMNSGVLEVRFQDRTVKYQSASDLRTTYASLYRQIYPNRTRQIRVFTSKGW